jgi:hypothetical protein
MQQLHVALALNLSGGGFKSPQPSCLHFGPQLDQPIAQYF